MAGKMQVFEDFNSVAEEVGIVTFAGAIEINLDCALDASGAGAHNDNSVAHVDGFVDIVGDEDHGGAASFPKAKDFILHAHAGEGIESAEGFIEQKDLGVVDEGA